METQINISSCSFCRLITNAKITLDRECIEFHDQFTTELNQLISYEEQIESSDITTTIDTDQQLEEFRYEVKAAYNNYLYLKKRLSYYTYLYSFHQIIHHYE